MRKKRKDFRTKTIKGGKTLGQRLYIARRRKKISLEKAEKETKVRIKYLQALEEGKYEKIPSDVYARGFLMRYCDFLGLKKESILEAYRGERGIYQSINKETITPTTKAKETVPIITPRTLAIVAVAVIILALGGYVWYGVKGFTAPPKLEISSPAPESVTDKETIDISGSTDEGATLSINNQSVAINDNGDFFQQVRLQPGINTIEVKAYNKMNKQTVKIIKVLANFKF